MQNFIELLTPTEVACDYLMSNGIVTVRPLHVRFYFHPTSNDKDEHNDSRRMEPQQNHTEKKSFWEYSKIVSEPIERLTLSSGC